MVVLKRVAAVRRGSAPDRLAEIDLFLIGEGTRGRASRTADHRTGDRRANQNTANRTNTGTDGTA